jgi:sortase (surface protein transpeptidase)
VKASGERRTYELVDRETVKRGDYQQDWFRLHGEPQVTLFTCSDLRNGKYERTRVLVGVPVEQV